MLQAFSLGSWQVQGAGVSLEQRPQGDCGPLQGVFVKDKQNGGLAVSLPLSTHT